MDVAQVVTCCTTCGVKRVVTPAQPSLQRGRTGELEVHVGRGAGSSLQQAGRVQGVQSCSQSRCQLLPRGATPYVTNCTALLCQMCAARTEGKVVSLLMKLEALRIFF